MDKGAKVFLVAAGAATFGVWLLTRTVAGKEVFVCPYCDEEFSTYDELVQHILGEHPDLPEPEPEPPPEEHFVCPYCSAEFTDWEDLRQHILLYHPTYEPPPEPEPPEPEPEPEPEPPPEPEPEPEPEPQAQFYMPPTMEVRFETRWEMPPYYYVYNYRCEITNIGDGPGTHIITVSTNRPDWYEPWTFSITLGPGKSYIWSNRQLSVAPMTFYLDGDWKENNHSVGVPS